MAFFVVGRIFDIPWAHIPWSGFADLLANLIEKYASELDVKNLPAPAVPLEDQDSAAADKKESVFRPEAVSGKTAARYNRRDIRVQTNL